MDRDNVPPGYLRTIRVAVLNATFDRLGKDEAPKTWVREACSDPRVSDDAVRATVSLRFGDNAVAYDPSDPEANNLSVSEGRPVVHGGSLSGAEWDNVRRAGVLPPAGIVTPSPKPYSPDGDPLNAIPKDQWTPGMRQVATYAAAIGGELLDCAIDVTIVRHADWPYTATYGNGTLTINLGCCGHSFFDNGITDEINDVLIHEYGHHYASGHLNAKYYRALTSVGARMVRLALAKPELFR
jgi:hypothetical protein